MPASLCVVHRGQRPTGRTGCARSGRWCPCRTRTCVRYVSDSRPTAGRTGHGCRRAEGGGFEPRGLMTPTDFRNRAPATPAAPSRSTFSRTHCSDVYGTRTRTSRIDDPALFHRAHAPGGVVAPESGWPESNPAGSAPRTPRASQPAPQPVESSGGRGRSPASWLRARCAAGYTTPEWCVPGGSNSDPRGKSPLGFQLPQRRWEAGDRPARASGGD